MREMEEVNKDYGEVIFDHLHATAFHGSSLGKLNFENDRNCV